MGLSQVSTLIFVVVICCSLGIAESDRQKQRHSRDVSTATEDVSGKSSDTLENLEAASTSRKRKKKTRTTTLAPTTLAPTTASIDDDDFDFDAHQGAEVKTDREGKIQSDVSGNIQKPLKQSQAEQIVQPKVEVADQKGQFLKFDDDTAFGFDDVLVPTSSSTAETRTVSRSTTKAQNPETKTTATNKPKKDVATSESTTMTTARTTRASSMPIWTPEVFFRKEQTKPKTTQSTKKTSSTKKKVSTTAKRNFAITTKATTPGTTKWVWSPRRTTTGSAVDTTQNSSVAPVVLFAAAKQAPKVTTELPTTAATTTSASTKPTTQKQRTTLAQTTRTSTTTTTTTTTTQTTQTPTTTKTTSTTTTAKTTVKSIPVTVAPKPAQFPVVANPLVSNLMSDSVVNILVAAPPTTKTPVEKRAEVAVKKFNRGPGEARSIRVGDIPDQKVLIESMQKSAKPQNLTGLKTVKDDVNAPFLDGTYLSDPWMCRVKRDIVKSPVIMETCNGTMKEIVDLRVYKLVGIPTEECVTTPVFLGDRCTSLNGGKARCAQRYVRYGLIAKDIDTDKRAHECFRFPTACLCQLLIGDISPLPLKDEIGKL